MKCCGGRDKLPGVRAEQKWDYINLDDFHSTSCWTPLSYGILYISLIISVAVYAVDTFTAINLLAFARWSGQIKPYLPMEYSRWIFAGCIILSFVLLFFRWLRAIRVMKGGSVAESYLDPLAVRVQSVRVGKEGRGWKRFLVFAELTKGKKGADYVALFTHFSFEAWLRILLAEGPRQVINALTLYSVMQLNLLPTGDNAAKDGHTPIAQFFVNVGFLVNKSGKEQAVILFGMLFTLVIWAITLINLMVAVVLYLLFLFHHIPSSDGGLTGYCRRKINMSMDKIVRVKMERALRKENALRARQETVGGDVMKRQPTLPDLDMTDDEKPPLLSRQTTQASLPEYTSRPGTAASGRFTSVWDVKRQPSMPDLTTADCRPGRHNRIDTHASSGSWASSSSDVPLTGGAGGMGYETPEQMESHLATSPAGGYGSRGTSNRSYTGYSHSAQYSYTAGIGPPPTVGQHDRSIHAAYQMERISRSETAMSGRYPPGTSPSPIHSYDQHHQTEHDNPYFAPSSGYSIQPLAVTLSRTNTAGGVSARSHTPGMSSSMRSIIPPSASYSRPYPSKQAPLPRLHSGAPSSGDGYQSYSAFSCSSAQPAFTPRTLYRSYSQPDVPAMSPRQYHSHNIPQQPTSAYTAQQEAGHTTPTQRPAISTPTSWQVTPQADPLIDDILRGY